MKKVILILIVLMSVNSLYSQKNKKGLLIVPNTTNRIEKAYKIYYYGWDLSKTKLTDGDMIGKSAELPPKIGSILGLLSERFSTKTVSKYLKKEVVSDLDVIQKRVKDIDYDDFVTFNSYEISKEKLIQIVASYELSDKEGVGLVVIGENMNKVERYATAYITFFDLNTRELLWVTKMKGLPGSKWGFSKYWYEGFLECFHYFFGKYY